jgi:hypothetical protein
LCLQKITGSDIVFLILYIDDILLLRNDIFTFISKVLAIQEFLHK